MYALSKQNPPRKHHYIPKNILRNFTDLSGQLWFARHDWKSADVRKTSPSEIFAQNDLNTWVHNDGTKDVSLENFFADMDGFAAGFIKEFANIIRNDGIPSLDEAAWNFWRNFWFYLIKKSPGYIDFFLERSKIRETLDEGLRTISTQSLDRISDGQMEANLDRIVKNVVVEAMAEPASPRLQKFQETLGIVVFRIIDSRCCFVVGDVLGASAKIGGEITSISGENLFLPLSHDIALGLLLDSVEVKVVTVGRDQVRDMNAATTRRSKMIAGRSPALINSLMRSETYRGVEFQS